MNLIRKCILALIGVVTIFFSFIDVAAGVFPLVLMGLFLLWILTFIFEGIYQIKDIPLLLLVITTFACGRAFSIQSFTIRGIPLYVTEIFLGFAFLFLISKVKSLLKQSQEIFPMHLLTGMGVYFGVGLVYFVIGAMGNGTPAFRDIVFFLYVLFFLITVILLRDEFRINALVSLLSGALPVLIFTGLVYTFWVIPGGTAFNLFISEIKMFNLCFYLGLVLIFCLALFESGSTKLKILWAFLIYISLLFIILVEVRASWFGLVLALMFLAVTLRKDFRVMVGITVLLIISIVLVDHYQLAIRKNRLNSLQDRVQTVVTPTQTSVAGANIKWRLDIWNQTMAEIVERPIWGWGYGIQIDYIQWKKRLSWLKAKGQGNGILPAHNHLLSLTYKMGLTGLVMFIYINLRIFIYGLGYLRHCQNGNNRRLLIAALAALIYWHGMALFFDVIESPPTSIFLWIILGLIVAIVSTDKNVYDTQEYSF